ncbi:hypothetical protein BDR07DRAFT_1019256 [Suillus spraguei]|nr:hypothetical protein BDR07DRAFT_1019256 [Suillus spraguei]
MNYLPRYRHSRWWFTITEYPLAVASTSKNIKYDGILGIGPRQLTINTLRNNNDPIGTYPTFTDYLVRQAPLVRTFINGLDCATECSVALCSKLRFPDVVGIFFQPTTGDLDTDVGELAFGEPDYTKFTGNIVYTAVTAIVLSTSYWGIDQSITTRLLVIMLFQCCYRHRPLNELLGYRSIGFIFPGRSYLYWSRPDIPVCAVVCAGTTPDPQCSRISR